jgi:anaerobic magnesium-protoporphyrin IX monomethyl ester cyclase
MLGTDSHLTTPEHDRTVLLVVPPQRGLLEGFSTGLIAIANYLRLHVPSCAVRLLDLTHEPFDALPDLISDALLAASGRVFVGITGTTASYQSMLRTAAVFKATQPSCVVVMGGHHATAQDELILRRHSDVVDFVVRGEGEVAMAALVTRYPDVEAVPNLSYVADGAIRRNLEAQLLGETELDSLGPGVAEGGVDSAAGKFDRITYVSARGCPLRCSFCVVRASTIRSKSIPAIIEDLRYLVGTLGFEDLAIEDNFFAHHPKRTLALCAAIEALRSELPFTWDCQTRVESMRRADIVEAMARAGCTAAYLGVESLVAKHLLYLGKTQRPERYLHALETEVVPNLLDAGLSPYLNLQLGLPGETHADRAATVAALARLGKLAEGRGAAITVFPQLAVIYPGTPHFEMAVAKGHFGKLGDEVFETFTAWEAKEEPILNYLGEHFAHGVGGIPIGILDGFRLLKGEFQISAAALLNVSTELRRLDRITGVRVFRYGQYLTRAEPRTAACA